MYIEQKRQESEIFQFVKMNMGKFVFSLVI